MKKNYIIPFEKRFTEIGRYRNKTKIMVVDNIGIYVSYEKEADLTTENIRRHLIGVTDCKILVYANDIEDALKQFFEMDGAKAGFKHKAMTLLATERNHIIEYSNCPHLLELESGIFCQRYVETGEIDKLLCILDGCDYPPEDCIIKIQKELDIKPINIGGDIWIKKYSEKFEK